MAEEVDAMGGKRVTLDGQLTRYWEREAIRLDDLAKRATFRWLARGYARKAARARAQAERSRAREAVRRSPLNADRGTGAEDTAGA